MDPITLSTILSIGSKVIDKVFPDPEKADAAKFELFKMQQTGELAVLAADTELAKGQLDVNKTEAASSSLFVAGWRPFVGWTCGVAFAYKFVIAPFAVLILTASGNPIDLPTLDFTEMSTILFGMLGLGGFRTMEKIKGVA